LRGFKVRFHLYTVPGQVFYEASRKLILKGVDGLLFVVDSDPLRLDANAEAWEGLQRNLRDYELSIPPLPAVIQYNKRDVPGALPVAELCEALGNPDLPQFESIATEGTGVFESLKALARGVLHTLQTRPLQSEAVGFNPTGLAVNPGATGVGGAPGEQPPVAAGQGVEPIPPQIPDEPTPGLAPAEASRPPVAPPSSPEVQRASAAVSSETVDHGSPPAGGKGVDSPSPSAAKPKTPRPVLVQLATEPATSRPDAVTSRPKPPQPAGEPREKRRGFGWFRRSR
jgi:hypothetical protein